jgi:putative hydrolase of the HAD superfamily
MKAAKDSLLKGVVFDLYGTLLLYGDMMQAWKDWASYCHEIFSRQGYQKEESDFLHAVHHFFSDMPRVPYGAGYSIYETAFYNKAQELGIKEFSREDLRTLADQSCAVWQEHIKLDPEVHEFLQELKTAGYKLALLTNFDHTPHINKVLAEHNLREYFDVIMVSEETGYKKPEKEIFDEMARRLSLRSDQCIYIGDHPEKDWKGAHGAGWRALLIQRKGEIDRLHLDFEADLKAGAGKIPGLDYCVQIKNLRELIEYL